MSEILSDVILADLMEDTESLQQQIIQDNGLLNIHTGLNVPGQGKLASVSVGQPPNLSLQQLDNLYRSSNLIANLVNLLPDAITQEWVDYKCPDNPELEFWMQQQLDGVSDSFNQALKKARLFGGACLILFVGDSYRPGNTKPINFASINEFNGCQVLGVDEIHPHSFNNNLFSVDYKKINYWQLKTNLHLTPNQQENQYLIHADRVLPFYGVKRLGVLSNIYDGFQPNFDYVNWGDSVVLRAYKKLVNLDQSDDAIATSLQSFNQTILFIHDLAKKTMHPEKKEMVKAHLRTVAFLQSVLGILALDAEHERYEILSRNYSQIPEVLEHVKQMAASATDIPLTQLLNRSPSGQTSGSSERNDWARFVASRQKVDVLPQLQTLVKILHLCKNNPTGGVAPQQYELVFPSVLKLTELEEAEMAEKQAVVTKTKTDSLANLITAGVDLKTALEIVKF